MRILFGSARSVYSSYGAVWGQYDYTPFGEKSGGTTPHNSYIDRERDGESSLMDFGVRKFDPVLKFTAFRQYGRTPAMVCMAGFPLPSPAYRQLGP